VKALRVAALGATVLFATGVQTSTTADTLRSIAASYYAKAGQIASITGRDSAMDYYQRLVDDGSLLSEPGPSEYPASMWRHSVQAFAQLDASLATQLLQLSFVPMASIRGLGETFVRSSVDGTMQPAAVYVPSGYSATKPAPLVVFLHGRFQAESHLVALPFIEDLAERTGTIVIAPYGRGYYDFNGSERDVYDAFDAASRAFAIDAHKRYLAGYSMGGFSAFNIATTHPGDWTALMCISGSLLASRAQHVTATLPNARFYVLTGARDDIVPTQYPTQTATYLRDAGLAVSFYSQADGTHLLYSLRPILSQAWDDMVRGVVRTPLGLSGGDELPDATP
jgi:pimeloyl-ACP methyl ester carboxylesterase